MSRIRATTLTVVLLTALACSPTTPSASVDAAAVRAAIDSLNLNWARLTAAAHADSLAGLHAENATLMPPNMSAVSGRAAIAQFYAVMNTVTPPPTLTIKADTVIAHADDAIDIGRWTFVWPDAAKRPPGVPAVDSGKYVARWVKEGGQWKLAQDIWNASTPMAPPR